MRVICVDDEQPVLDNFKIRVKDFTQIQSLHLFSDAREALRWAENYPIDIAFLDIEMAGINGLDLAKQLKAIDRDIRIFFVTAYEQYALDAFKADALGYILKPYSKQELQDAFEKAALMKSRKKSKVVIQTIPDFCVSVDGEKLHINRAKVEELFALLVDRAEVGVSARDAIDCLWPERLADENTMALYRVTFHRLLDCLKEVGIDYIIENEIRKKYIDMNAVDCDLYHILEGDREKIQNYAGEYLKEYSWAESRNAQLNSIKAAWENKR